MREENQGSNAEPTGGQDPASGANQESASGGQPSGAPKTEGFGGEGVQVILERLNRLEQVSLERARESQSHTDKSIASFRKELEQQRSSPQAQDPIDGVRNRLIQAYLAGGASYDQAVFQTDQIVGPARYAAQPVQSHREDMESLERLQALEVEAEIRRRCQDAGVDANDKRLEKSDRFALQESIHRIKEAELKAELERERKEAREREAAKDAKHLEELKRSGALDVLGRGTARSPGSQVQLANEFRKARAEMIAAHHSGKTKQEDLAAAVLSLEAEFRRKGLET